MSWKYMCTDDKVIQQDAERTLTFNTFDTNYHQLCMEFFNPLFNWAPGMFIN